jgi:general secretion pathway protein D
MLAQLIGEYFAFGLRRGWRQRTRVMIVALVALSVTSLGLLDSNRLYAADEEADAVADEPVVKKVRKPVKRRAKKVVSSNSKPIAPVAQAATVTPGTAAPKGATAQADQFTLNFADADIRVIIEAVSKYTGRNFIVDPQVKGKVTIISQRPMNAKQIYEVFLSILKVHGYAAVPGKDVIKIVPDANAKQEAIDNMNFRRDSSSDEVVTHVIEVKHVDAGQLVPILRPLVPQRGHLAAVPTSNVIIISDSASNIARIVQIINRIDQVTGDELEVIPLAHASATELLRILSQLDTKDPKAPQERTKMVADERTNSLLISGDKSARLRVRALIAHLDTPVEIGGNTHVVYLRNAVAKDLVPVLTGIASGKGGVAGAKPAGAGGELNIQADQNTNALVITAPLEVFRSLKSVIQQLDVRRAQVIVEAVIAEVSNNASRELGVQWGVDGTQSGNAVGLVNFNLGTPITAYANLASPPSPVGFNVGFGNFNSTTRIAALLSMLAGDAYTNILSTPSLVTLDNEEASIVVGQNVPFVTGSFSSTGGTAAPSNPFQTIERKDVGLTLKIKPQINEGDAIKLDVTQEVSSISTSAAAASDLITNKRSIKTSVIVDDGQIVVLGGLIEDNLIESEQKVPGLGDIPILGWLFRYQKTSKVKTNLMVFLHPTIMKDEKSIRAMTTEKYNFIRAQQAGVREKGVKLMSDEVSPILPELQELLKLPPAYEDSKQRQELSTPPEQSSRRAPPVAIPERKPSTSATFARPPVNVEPAVVPEPQPVTADQPPPVSVEQLLPANPDQAPPPAPDAALPLLPPASDENAGRVTQ